MGEVHRARDSRLKRDVAIKVLPDSLAHEPERFERFQREAEFLATLNHPNIAAVYGLEQSDGFTGIVLELVEGDTLADLIGRGPIPIEEALAIARQIADALEAAHEKGIVHRDLKPANVKVTRDGQVKVLDFGLAAAAPDPSRSNVNVSHSPTLTLAATQAGVVLGTAGYMSPEQAAAKPVDKRADIWSFGVVLWEMLTGRKLFEGETISHTLADVLRAPVDFDRLPPHTPPAIADLVRRCLDRDVKTRLRDIGEARVTIDKARSTPPQIEADRRATQRRPAWDRALPWATAAAAIATTGVLLVVIGQRRTPALLAPMRVEAKLGADVSLVVNQGAAAVLSPRGDTLAFVAQRGNDRLLFLRHLDQLQAEALAGTAGAFAPFFSPDGEWIAFFADGQLKKISARGGAPIALCQAPNARGGSWADDGTIVFQPTNSPNSGLVRVSSGGGKPETLTTIGDGEVTQRWPHVLPGSKAVLYSGHTATTAWDDARVTLQVLPNGPRRILQRGGYFARYVPSGHILYIHESTLFAMPFDLDRLEVTGQAVPVLEGVNSTPAGGAAGSAQFSVSDTGVIAYSTGQSPGVDAPIVFLDRAGHTAPLRPTPSNWSSPAFSPDGSRLALDIFDGKKTDIWIYQWMRDTLTRLTFEAGREEKPVWTPDGQRVVFSWSPPGQPFNLYWRRADGTGETQRLTESTNEQTAWSWHPDGKVLAFIQQEPGRFSDIMLLTVDGDEATGWKPRTPTVFLNSPASERNPAFSPDGKWIAYTSNESSRDEVYVRPFPGPGGKWQVSTDGGDYPAWSPTKRELYYGAPPVFMAVPYSTDGSSFRAERPVALTDVAVGRRPRWSNMAVHPDGQRWAAAAGANESATKLDSVKLMFNVFDELRRLAPPRR